MATPFQTFQAKLGLNNPSRKGVGFNYAPFTIQQGQATPGQTLYEKVGTRKEAGANIYNQNKGEVTSRLASDLVSKSAGQVQTDEFGLPVTQLTNFQDLFSGQLKGIGQRGNLALQTAQAKNAWHQAKEMQDLGQYGFSGYSGSGDTSGTAIPGAKGNNPGAKAAAMAMQAQRNGTPYVYGGNSLSTGVDCSGLVQQIYRQLGVSIPRTTYEQARNGKRVPLSDIRPGDLVFYNNYGHVGIYVGHGHIVHAANSRLGVITSNLNNSNGAPVLVLRPY